MGVSPDGDEYGEDLLCPRDFHFHESRRQYGGCLWLNPFDEPDANNNRNMHFGPSWEPPFFCPSKSRVES